MKPINFIKNIYNILVSEHILCRRCQNTRHPGAGCNNCGFYENYNDEFKSGVTSFPLGDYYITMIEEDIQHRTLVSQGETIIAKLPFRVSVDINLKTLNKYLLLV